jgi:hypothetical protein
MKTIPLTTPIVLFLALASTAAAVEIRVDCGRPVGRIKPIHGVNNGPLANGENAKLGRWYAEAGFPVARLHDVRWPSPDAVDVSTIFPLAHLDPDDPRNYLFAKTDDYLAAILAAKSRIVYRLGQSIEPWSKYHTHPPRDTHRFARVCVNIIRHYNDGWADGFHHGITHWEIWNEPDMKLPLQWLGTQKDYFRLYETVARAIKAHDPKLKVGGPALTSMSSDWARPFVAHCREQRLPLDFFSFHVYASKPQVLVDSCRQARKLLDEHGFKETEIHLNEWRYHPTWNGLRPDEPEKYVDVPGWFARGCSGKGAAFAATVLMRLQDEPVDMTNFYTADTSAWSMFGQFGIRTPVYHAFKAFNELATHPNRVACEVAAAGAATPSVACAGLGDDGRSAVVLVSTFEAPAGRREIVLSGLPGEGRPRIEALLVDDTRALAPIPVEPLEQDANTADGGSPRTLRVVVDLPADAVCLLRCLPER